MIDLQVVGYCLWYCCCSAACGAGAAVVGCALLCCGHSRIYEIEREKCCAWFVVSFVPLASFQKWSFVARIHFVLHTDSYICK